MSYDKCQIQFFQIDIINKSIIVKTQSTVSNCSSLNGLFIQSQNLLIYFYSSIKHRYIQVSNYPDFKLLSLFYDANDTDCTLIQNYHESFKLFSSVCMNKASIFNLNGEIIYNLVQDRQNPFNLVKRESGKVNIYNLATQKMENKITLKSNIVYMLKQDSTNMLFIGQSSGDILYTDMQLKQQYYFKIQNDLKNFFVHPIQPKIYCIQLTNLLQQTDMNVGLYTQELKEGQFKFNESGSPILQMHFSVRLKQIIFIQDYYVYFIDIRTNQIATIFDQCEFGYNLIEYSFLDEKNNILILSSQYVFCSISLITMEVLYNKTVKSICPKISSIYSKFSNNKDGYIQFIGQDENWDNYYVILNIEDLKLIQIEDFYSEMYNSLMSFDQESQKQFLITSSSDTQILTITDYKLNILKKHNLPQNSDYQSIYFLCKQYALITNMRQIFIIHYTNQNSQLILNKNRGLGVFISLETFEILLSKQYFSTSFTSAYYNYETKLLLISSDASNFQLSKLDIDTGDEIVYYQKQICKANNLKVMHELDIFIITCMTILEDDNTFIKVMKFSTGELVFTVKSESFINQSIFIQPFEILLYEVEYTSENDDLLCEATLANLSQFYNPNQVQQNMSRQIYFINFIWQQDQDIYFVASREGNIYEYFPTKSTFKLIQVFKSQILSFGRINSDLNNNLVFIQLPTKILIYNLQTRQTIQELNYRNNQFHQSKNHYLIIKRPFTLIILSLEFQIVKELTLSNKINEIKIISLEKEYALITSFDGFISLINIQDGKIIWKKQIEQNRIQGFYLNQQFTMLLSFSREQKLNIFSIKNLKDNIKLQLSIKLDQIIKNLFIIDNKIIITYLNFRYIDIYEYEFQDEKLSVQYKDFLILPFKIQSYVVEIINENSQLIAYSDFQYAIYNLENNQIVFKSSKSYFANKIVQITSISKSMFLISCEQDIEVVQIDTQGMQYRKDYSVWKSLSLISSNSFKVFNLIKKYNDNNQIEYLILIGSEIQSIKNYEVQLIDFSNIPNTDKGCHISYKSVSYYDLNNKLKSLYDLNRYEFNTYKINLIVEADNIKSFTSIPQFIFSNATTITFDGSSNGQLINFLLNSNLTTSIKVYRVEFIKFNLILQEKILFYEIYQKQVLIKDCNIIQDFVSDFQNYSLLKFFKMNSVELINLNITNLSQNFTYIIFIDNISELTISNLYLSKLTLQSSIVVYCNNCIVINAKDVVIENNILDIIDIGSQIFQFNNVQYLVLDNLKIHSNKGINNKKNSIDKQSSLIKLVNCQNVEYYNAQFISNENLILFSISSKSITDTLEIEEIVIYKLIYIFIQNILVHQNLNNNFPLIYFDSVLIINIKQAKFTQNECSSTILNFTTIQKLKIDIITFEKNISISGIQIINSPSIIIKNGIFLSNIGLLNGGVFKISNDDFVTNQDINNIIEKSQFIYNTALYSGGAIYLENSNLNISDCYFQENVASIGGAIRYTGFQPKFIQQKFSNQYHKNKAFIFGQNLGSYPKFAVVDSRRKLDELVITDYRSGDTINSFMIYILDEEKNIINTKYEEYLRNIKNNIKTQTRLNLNNIEECYKNATNLINDEIEQYVISVISLDDDVLSVSNMTMFYYDSTNDYFELQGLVIYGIPESSAEILFQAPFIKQFNKIGELKDNSNHTVIILFRKCLRGELYQKRTDTLYTCDKCLDNRYSLIDPNISDTSQICKQCQSDQAESCELDKILLKKGFWRESTSTDEIFYCENSPSNCEGTESTQYCSEGYIGPLCEECDNYGEVWGKIYARSNSYNCKDCNQNYLIYIKISLVTVAVSVYFYITVKKQLERSCKRAICIILRQTNMLAINMSCQRNEEVNSIQKLLIHFLQITSVMTMNKKLHFDIHEISSIFGQPQTVVSSSFDCILSQQRFIPIHYVRAMYGLFLPIQYIGVSILLQSIFWLFLRFQLKKQFIISSINFGILFFQTGIIKTLIDIIFCRKIGQKFYIKSQINYECYTTEHLDYIYQYFLPLSLILVFILPLLVFYSLRKNKQRLKYNASAIIKYGLFFLDYKEKTYYWEFIKILLRLMIILVMNFFDQYTQLKYDTCIVMLITYCLFILKLQPYFLAQLNQYDIILTSMTVILFMIERIIVSESNISNIFTTIFFVVLVGIWSFFAYIIIKTIFISKVLLSLSRFTFLQKYLKIKQTPNSMQKFILWKKLKNNLMQVSQQIQQNYKTSRTLKTMTLNTESSVQQLRTFKESPIRKLSRQRSIKQNISQIKME